MEPVKYQAQHRTPEILLKQFGFEKDGIWYVIIFDRATRTTAEIRIKDFNKAINEFDYPDDDFKIKRHYENTAGIIEGNFQMVLSSIKNQHQLTPRHEDILRHFVASLIVRSERHRKIFEEMIADKDARARFIEEILIFNKQDKPNDIELAVQLLDQGQYVSLLQGVITNHIVHVLRSFKAVILRDFDGRGWFTSDDPVCIDFQDNYTWIIPVEAEIYLPLSNEYCLFLFHDKSPLNNNPLRSLKPNKIHKIDEATHYAITQRIIDNANRNLIVCSHVRSYLDELSRSEQG